VKCWFLFGSELHMLRGIAVGCLRHWGAQFWLIAFVFISNQVGAT